MVMCYLHVLSLRPSVVKVAHDKWPPVLAPSGSVISINHWETMLPCGRTSKLHYTLVVQGVGVEEMPAWCTMRIDGGEDWTWLM